MDIGTGRDQGATPAITESSGKWMRGNAKGKTAVLATHPVRNFRVTRQHPGHRLPAGVHDTLSDCRRHGRQQEFNLPEVAGDENQPLLDRALFQFQQTQHGRAIEGVAAKPVDRFGWIGNDATGGNSAYRFTNMPGFTHYRVTRVPARR